ncbi:YXWGXW repeat-containing protein [Telmatocola sphagniphila]|uniref:YXWGXW repeat-containing protein n=1 Tax=Telmatocola sphagniphila TaxID=1123043 RepID=A0A8E6B482_9BACT|nr:YXWGXW repeat-containing protein [Telmatocola sphagniphila]QVL31037.1 YXWGXW repeat-containing protein [Telmatocola sphagniphila]
MYSIRSALTASLLGLIGLAPTNAARAQQVQIPDIPQGVDVQARGPVHEAFAQPSTAQPTAGPLAPKQPPAPVDEMPPDQKPEGDNVQWISGYWSWDDETKDFLWISGFWRATPPGRHWLAGHWQQTDQGWQWAAGFWAPDNTTQIQYLPTPPQAIEESPAPAPDANSTFVPGTWVYVQTKYYWRPGFWVPNRIGWVWIPGGYIWTPNGYIFVSGYWDHPLDERGMLFAPVRFGIGWRGGRYIPSFVIGTDFMIGSFFVRLNVRSYYFGDYFEARYASRGFVAWPDYRVGKFGIDPNFSYYRRVHANDVRWEANLRELYKGRASGIVPRPPHTLAAQIQAVNALKGTRNAAVLQSTGFTHLQNVSAVTPLKDFHNVRVTNLSELGGVKASVPAREIKVRAVANEERARELKVVEQSRQTAQIRHQEEAKIFQPGKAPVIQSEPRSIKLEIPKPIPHVGNPGPVMKAAPPLPTIPNHMEREIPKFEPKRP